MSNLIYRSNQSTFCSEILERLDHIDNQYSDTRNRTSAWVKLGKQIHKAILREDRKTGEYATSLYNYHNILGEVRARIMGSGRKHPSLSSSMRRSVRIGGASKYYLAKSINELPAYENDLKAIAKMPADTMQLGVDALTRKIEGELTGTPANNAVEIVSNTLFHHPMIAYLEKPKRLKKARKEADKKSLDYKNNHVKKYNAKRVIELAESLLSSESYPELSWALALLTGRRAVEILHHAKFEKIDSNYVLFSGQSKKRKGVNADSFPIPVLAESDLIIDALSRLRSNNSVSAFKDGTGSFNGSTVEFSKLSRRDLNKAINQKTSGVLNDRAKRLMNDPAEVFKNTRGFYAAYCTETFRVKDEQWAGMNTDAFLQAILGHADINEVKHYKQVEFSDFDGLKQPEEIKVKPAKPTEKAKKDTRNASELKDIYALLEGLDSESVEVVTGKNSDGSDKLRAVKVDSIRGWHNNKLRFWAYENSGMKITQTVVEKNRGNTHKSGTGSVDVRCNRFTFRAWALIAGDLLSQYNSNPKRA